MLVNVSCPEHFQQLRRLSCLSRDLSSSSSTSHYRYTLGSIIPLDKASLVAHRQTLDCNCSSVI
jgi:hypothetical protein